MEGGRFDTLTRAVGRRAFAALGAGGLATAMRRSVAETARKKKRRKNKKKCKKPQVKCGKQCCAAGKVCNSGQCTAPTTPPPPLGCQITRTATTWTLQADCTITETIEIANGVTFNGNNKTITMTGSLEGFRFSSGFGGARAAGILARQGTANIQHLTVTSRGLETSSGSTLEDPVAIAFVEASGTIAYVYVIDVVTVNEFGSRSGGGIFVTASDGEDVEFDHVAVGAYSSPGIELMGSAGAGLSATIARSSVAGASQAVSGASIDFAGAGNFRVFETEIFVNSASEGLRIRGSGVLHGTIEQTVVSGQGQGGFSFTGIRLANADGGEMDISISNTTVQIAVDDWQTIRPTGIEVTNLDNDHELKAMMTNVTLDLMGPAATGLLIAGKVEATLAESMVTLDVNYPSVGLYALSFDSELTPNVMIDQTTVESLAATTGSSQGVVFDDASSGALQATTIRGFQDTDPDPQVRSCGLAIEPGATVDYQGADLTFASNDEDICDPYEPPATSTQGAITQAQRALQHQTRPPQRRRKRHGSIPWD